MPIGMKMEAVIHVATNWARVRITRVDGTTTGTMSLSLDVWQAFRDIAKQSFEVVEQEYVPEPIEPHLQERLDARQAQRDAMKTTQSQPRTPAELVSPLYKRVNKQVTAIRKRGTR